MSTLTQAYTKSQSCYPTLYALKRRLDELYLVRITDGQSRLWSPREVDAKLFPSIREAEATAKELGLSGAQFDVIPVDS